MSFDSDVPEQFWHTEGLFTVKISHYKGADGPSDAENFEKADMHMEVLKVLATTDEPDAMDFKSWSTMKSSS